MIDHLAARYALRTLLTSLSVATTGSVALSATSTGYTRSSGSFLTDGFRPGMEITAVSGFVVAGNNLSNAMGRLITAVDATSITCSGTAADPEVSGRVITVGLPYGCAWENIDFVPTDGHPFVEEDYLPGPAAQIALGTLGDIESLPTYVIKWYGLSNSGPEATASAVTALLRLFAPRTALTLSTGDVLRVRTDTAPYAGQLLNQPSSRAVCVVTVPLRAYSANIS